MAYKIDVRQCLICQSRTAKVPLYWVACVWLPGWYCSEECYLVDLEPGGVITELWRLTSKK